MQEDVSSEGRASDLLIDLAALKATVAQLPGKGFIVAAVIGGMALFAGLITFADQIRHLFGVR